MSPTSLVALAAARTEVANFLDSLLLVYMILIIVYVLTSMIVSLGARMPYSRVGGGILGFLRDTCEPYLRIFRRFIPMLGPFDLSPIVAILALSIVGNIVVAVIRG